MITRGSRFYFALAALAYVAAIGGVVHFWWLVKQDTTEPIRWAAAVAVLLGFRIWWHWRTRVWSRS